MVLLRSELSDRQSAAFSASVVDRKALGCCERALRQERCERTWANTRVEIVQKRAPQSREAREQALVPRLRRDNPTTGVQDLRTTAYVGAGPSYNHEGYGHPVVRSGRTTTGSSTLDHRSASTDPIQRPHGQNYAWLTSSSEVSQGGNTTVGGGERFHRATMCPFVQLEFTITLEAKPPAIPYIKAKTR